MDTLLGFNWSSSDNWSADLGADTYNYNYEDEDYVYGNTSCSVKAAGCKDGLLIPMWMPENVSFQNDKKFRALAYIMAMVYVFAGVSIVTERFMSAIETITSQKKHINVHLPDGTAIFVTTRVYNETVANLTLMAFGSSALHILLTIIEVCGNNFEVGHLGPGTMFGSAAYNLFVVTAICVSAVPPNKTRKIKKSPVFLVTAAWSIFAFIWLFVILVVISKEVIEVWEAVLTCAFLPGVVVTAYLADSRAIIGKFLPRGSSVVFQATRDLREKSGVVKKKLDVENINEHDYLLRTALKQREEIAAILSKLKELNTDMDMTALIAMTKNEILNREPKSKAFYGGKRRRSKWSKLVEPTESALVIEEEISDNDATTVVFECHVYAVVESEGHVTLWVRRIGGDLSKVCLVDYNTEEGTAKEVTDFVATTGTLLFKPFQLRAQIVVEIISDEQVEDEEYFSVHLSCPRFLTDKDYELLADLLKKHEKKPSSTEVISEAKSRQRFSPEESKLQLDAVKSEIKLGHISTATVVIVDDSHPGKFHFINTTISVHEDCGDIPVAVYRAKGGRGRIRVPFQADNGTAIAGEDYNIFGDALTFEPREHEKAIMVRIINRERYRMNITFSLTLMEPELLPEDYDFKESINGNPTEAKEEEVNTDKPILGEYPTVVITIRESKAFKSAVDEILSLQKPSQMLVSTSWFDQFNDAISVNPDINYIKEDVDYSYIDIPMPSAAEYFSHFVLLTWKLWAALVPPPTYYRGWPCFFACVIQLGILAAIIGDLAASFGCSIQLKDSFIAITFVAIGASLPDTFSSKLAAVNEKYADSSIGIIPGNLTFNIFFGLGAAWTVAAVYHSMHGKQLSARFQDLAWNALLICPLSLLAFGVFQVRRMYSGGELGGSFLTRVLTSVVLIVLWVTYLTLSTLTLYCFINVT